MQIDSRSFRGRHIALITLSVLMFIVFAGVFAGPAAAINFSGSVHKATGRTPTALAVGDLNSDGRQDVVTANFNNNSISVFLQTTSGTLANAINYQLFPTTKTPITWPGYAWTTTRPSGIAIADMNGDGHNDVVVSDQWNWALFYFEQDNPSSMTDPLDSTPDLRQSQDYYSGAGLSQPPFIDPAEVFSTKDVSHKYAMAYRFHFTNINLDQPGDILYFTDAGGSLRELYHTAFSATDYTTPLIYTGGDLDGGMNVTFKISDEMTRTTSTWNIDYYQVFYDYRDTHPFSQPYSLAVGNLAHQRPGTELISANPLTQSFEIYGVSGGQLQKLSAPDDAGGNNARDFCYGVAVGDLNYDLFDDFAMAGWDSGNAMIWRQSSTNWLNGNSAQDVPIGDNAFSVAIGDLNGDGRNDLAGTSYAENKVTFGLQNTAAFFDRVQSLRTGDRPMGMTIADVTADHKNDIIVANSNANNVGVFVQSATATYTSQSTYPVGWYPYSVKTGDIDSDGGTEIVATNSNDNDITILQPSPGVSWITPSTAGASVKGTIYPEVAPPAGTRVSQVQFKLDGLLRATVLAKPWRFTLNTLAVSAGTHVLSATASDGHGHTSTTSRSFKVDNVAPGITYVTALPSPFYPIKRDNYKDNCYFHFKLTEIANVSIPVYLSGKLVKTLSATGRAGWNTVVWDGKRNDGTRGVGTYYYRIRATDLAGNSRATALKIVKVKYYVLVRVAPNKVILVPH